jgi:hypothetical protein
MIYPCTQPLTDIMIWEFKTFRSPIQNNKFSVYALDHLGNKLLCYAINLEMNAAHSKMFEANRLYDIQEEISLLDDLNEDF